MAKAGGADEGNGAIYGGFARLSRLLPGSATVSPSAFIELFRYPLGVTPRTGHPPRLLKDGKLQPCSPSRPRIVSSYSREQA